MVCEGTAAKPFCRVSGLAVLVLSDAVFANGGCDASCVAIWL